MSLHSSKLFWHSLIIGSARCQLITHCCVQVCAVSYQARISCAKTLIELEKYDVRFVTVFLFGYRDTPFQSHFCFILCASAW